MRNGQFSGDPITSWLTNANGDDRDMQLVDKFTLTDPAGTVWDAPANAVVNGASIPRPLSSLARPSSTTLRAIAPAARSDTSLPRSADRRVVVDRSLVAPAEVSAARGPRVQRFVTKDVSHATEMILSKGEVDDPLEIERRADQAMTTVTSLGTLQSP